MKNKLNSPLDFLKKIVQKIRFHIKMMRLDSIWRRYGGGAYSLFPPSFYYRHNRKEIIRLTEKELSRLRKMIQEYKRQNGLK